MLCLSGRYARGMSDQDPSTVDARTSQRDKSVARVIDPARQRAEQRVQQFLDTTREMLVAQPGSHVNVHEVVERSGLSLRSFYQHFGGRHELLLALFEDSARQTEALLRAKVEASDDPLERLHRLVVNYYLLSTGVRVGKGPVVPGLSQFAQSLLSDHPMEALAALQPIAVLFEEVLSQAAKSGVVQAGSRPRRRAAFLMQTVSFNAYVMAAVGNARSQRGEAAAAEDLWELLLNGLGSR